MTSTSESCLACPLWSAETWLPVLTCHLSPSGSGSLASPPVARLGTQVLVLGDRWRPAAQRAICGGHGRVYALPPRPPEGTAERTQDPSNSAMKQGRSAPPTNSETLTS